MDKVVDIFQKGVHNLIDPENIPKDAAQDGSNFVTQDGRNVLVGGRILLGAEGAAGSVTGLHKGYTPQGVTVLYRKIGTKIQYFNKGSSTWIDILTGLTSAAEYTFANYSSLAGSFTYINGVDGYWKVVNLFPTSPVAIFEDTRNFKGYILIDRGRTILWNRDKDKTGLYGSWIDRQNATVYTTVAGEVVGALGAANYVGTLAFKAGGARRTCFGVSFASTVAAGAESFTDNLDGTLTSNRGGTGTINYATGAFNITFSDVTTAQVTSGYQWEDSNRKGVSDFSYSSPRVAGEGFQFPQDEGGDAILNIMVGQDGAYYSLKERSAYRLSLDADDAGATNEVYRKELGLPFFRASISTNQGIFFLNTVNPTKPEMTILQRNTTGTAIEPRILFPHFKFSNYDYTTCGMASYDRWIMVFCKTASANNNNRILMCNLLTGTVDIVSYSGKMAIQDGASLYVGDSITQSVYSTFDGFDDLGSAIDAYWESKDFLLDTEFLKKFRKLRFKGFIDPDQAVGVWINIDEAGYSKVGTIVGSGSYVNYSESQAVGSHFIGQAQIGGDDVTNAYAYLMEIKLRTGKFRKISIKMIPEGIGYFDFDYLMFWDVFTFENRLPKAYRQKQNVSLDGLQTDQ